MPGYRPTPTREAEAETEANFSLLYFTLPCYLLLVFAKKRRRYDTLDC